LLILSSVSSGSNPKDTESVKAVREKEGFIIMGWIQQYWMKRFDIWCSVGSQGSCECCHINYITNRFFTFRNWSLFHDLHRCNKDIFSFGHTTCMPVQAMFAVYRRSRL